MRFHTSLFKYLKNGKKTSCKREKMFLILAEFFCILKNIRHPKIDFGGDVCSWILILGILYAKTFFHVRDVRRKKVNFSSLWHPFPYVRPSVRLSARPSVRPSVLPSIHLSVKSFSKRQIQEHS